MLTVFKKTNEEVITENDIKDNSTIDFSKVSDKIADELKKSKKELGHVNIILTGKSGAGKSTLINAVFRKKLAKTGIGRPVTQETKIYAHKELPLRLYDTVGIELSVERQEKVKNDLLEIINKGKNDPEQEIHAILYCVKSTSSRFEPFEADFIKEISENNRTPVIIVITDTRDNDEGKKLNKETERIIREKQVSTVKNIINVLALECENKKPFGLGDLIESIYDIIPDNARDAFVNVQNVVISMKVKRAQKWLTGFIVSSFTTGAAPIPFADAPILIANQVSMLAKITSLFGMDNFDKAMLTTMISTVIGCGGATIAGKTIVTNLLKLIPGANLVGGLISGTTAAVLTGALGEAYITVLSKLCKGEISECNMINALKEEFEKHNFKKQQKNILGYISKKKKEIQ